MIELIIEIFGFLWALTLKTPEQEEEAKRIKEEEEDGYGQL